MLRLGQEHSSPSTLQEQLDRELQRQQRAGVSDTAETEVQEIIVLPFDLKLGDPLPQSTPQRQFWN